MLREGHAGCVSTDMKLESGIDPSKKEEYLSDAGFADVFGQGRDKFNALPLWAKEHS